MTGPAQTTAAPAPAPVPGTSPVAALKELRYVQNVGRFEKASPTGDAGFGPCTLVFGENGWGKSTLADILRSLTTNNPAIIIGRKTLAGGPDQKVVLRVGTQQAVFERSAWTGPRPRIAIYDSVFINENVFSGDLVSADHLKNQYGLVVGEEGVRRVRRIVALDDENREINAAVRTLESQLDAVIRTAAPPGMKRDAFLALEKRDDVDAAIAVKETEVQRVRRAAELKAAAEPQLLPVPTEAQKFRDLLGSTIDGVAEQALAAVRAHVAAHHGTGDKSDTAHEAWLEAGLVFADRDDCPFCGQKLTDRTLVDAYKGFFGDAYKALAAGMRKTRETFGRYVNGDFRRTVENLVRQNTGHFAYWREAAKIDPPALPDIAAAIAAMEAAAAGVDAVFQDKQADLTAALAGTAADDALSAWDEARSTIASVNTVLEAYLSRVKALKGSIDPGDLPKLENELKTLQAAKRRHDEDIINVAAKLGGHTKRKEAIAKEKAVLRKELNDHGRAITTGLGKSINAYLGRLNAGFRIDYKEPDYRGKEPAASYQILINDVPVSPRSAGEALDQPSFRNTLSAGDKSTLALALFLARINADADLKDTIVVLDDPFTSLDNFRRQFTAIEIRKLCGRAAQTIILSHDKNFLRLLWEKIDQNTIKSIALQTGAPGVTTIAPFDVEAATQPRHVTERMEIEEYIEGEPHAPNYIRTRLRTVCENFYRKGDPGLFHEAASLEEIIRLLEAAPADHPYKGALEELKDINEYSRGDSHAAIVGNPSEETSDEELKGFCSRVLALTRGM